MRKTTEQFIEDSKKKFGDRFDYSKCVYTGAVNNVTLICKECGNEFVINAHGHLRTIDGGCKLCAIKKVSKLKRITQDEIIENSDCSTTKDVRLRILQSEQEDLKELYDQLLVLEEV